MIKRDKSNHILQQLNLMPVVAILGCRQVGKTTLALEISKILNKETLYLDLERPSDRATLNQAEIFLSKQKNKLVILDEIHLVPQIFKVLRSLVDERRRLGEKNAHFLILGSASPELLQQSSESLAGRIAYIELDPFNVTEIQNLDTTDPLDLLWVRGGFPESFLNSTDEESFIWRENFVRTYLKRDLPDLGPNLPAELVFRLWRMLALDQGCQVNYSKLAGNLSVSYMTVKNYIDVLTELYLVRQLKPWHGNSKKRLIKAPKIYVRDSGILHYLANIINYNDLASHPVYGQSWEGFVIEQIIQCLPVGTQPYFYRSSGGAEIDLVLEMKNGTSYALEIKRSLEPKISKGFYFACEDIKPTFSYYITPTKYEYPLANDVNAINVIDFLAKIRERG